MSTKIWKLTYFLFCYVWPIRSESNSLLSLLCYVLYRYDYN